MAVPVLAGGFAGGTTQLINQRQQSRYILSPHNCVGLEMPIGQIIICKTPEQQSVVTDELTRGIVAFTQCIVFTMDEA